MQRGSNREVTRRHWIRSSALAGALGLDALAQQAESRHSPLQGGKRIGLIEFQGESSTPLNSVQGDELDGRLYTDLSALSPANLVTPVDAFYIRTRASHLLDRRPDWRIAIRGGGAPRELTAAELQHRAVPMGLKLMECAGNTARTRFGLIGVASWEGVALSKLLENNVGSSRILIAGFDRYESAPRTASIPGASWIFSRKELDDAGAFLATRMNGKPLTADHGAPIRLVVPNWYGCACIKWVNAITAVNDDEPATSQMREYAGRTHQIGLPELARDYEPATLDPTAMPIQIEKWLVGGKTKYRVLGISWGGTTPARRLDIRFAPNEDYVPVDNVPAAPLNSWGVWNHLWTPSKPGNYRIRLRVPDKSIRTRRLDKGFYVREVQITDV